MIRHGRSVGQVVPFSALRYLLVCLALAVTLFNPYAASVAPAASESDLREKLVAATGQERLRVLAQLARILRESGSDEAVGVAQEARALARRLNLPDVEGEALIDLAIAKRARGEYLLALEAGSEALQIARDTGNLRLAASAHNILGLTENSRDEPAAGLRHSLDELEISTKIGDRRALSQSLNNVGNSYRRLGDYPKALSHHRRSLAIKLELGDRDGAGFSHHNIGEVLADQGLHREALASWVRAEAEWRATGNRRALAAALKSQGVALAALGRLDEASQRLNASIDLRRDPPNPHGEADTLVSLGRVQLRLGKYDEAEASYSRALVLAEKLDQTSLIGDALAGLTAAAAARGNIQTAEGLLEKQFALQRRMRELERSRIRSEMRATLEAHEAQGRAELLGQQRALQDEKLRRGQAERNMALIAAVLLLALAVIAAYGFRIKRKSERSLRLQARDLELALAQVRTLRGMLPICAWCHRKARDEAGRWTDFETFVQDHTEAVVTHTICPECQERNFPRPPSVPFSPAE